ncbi:hypothetical protein HRW14_17045 [Streptomyces lunaelactis]|uniref:hypothetical protein n=1 Tax=Streptomyces lunaelactis TaxID=1535768 RepID=UPI001585C70B|nr:hypothetical protein [Streptomyces lunaelactis]NUK51947.1 hypothetical protein [Streptomyces lunaelactis]NUK65900.1 hypothetical protein [Streptomyces lunaelactis]
MGAMLKNPPESMQHHLRQRLNEHARSRWPQLTRVDVRFRAGFADVAGTLPSGQSLPLCGLRFAGSCTPGASPSTSPSDGHQDGST